MIVPENGSKWKGRMSSDESSALKLKGCIKDPGYRYIYNHATRQVIDLRKCPIEWAWYNKDTGKAKIVNVSPLVLLLTMGNEWAMVWEAETTADTEEKKRTKAWI